MKSKPIPWTNNVNGGWLFENKHLILGNKFKQHNLPVAYDVINKLQALEWEIDTTTYRIEKQTNRAMNKQKFLRVIKDFLGIPFHFVWRYDCRGRSYSSGYDLNLQSNEYGKALLSLHNKEVITKLGKPNLYIAIANHAGMDHLTWEDRYDWAKTKVLDSINWERTYLRTQSCQGPYSYRSWHTYRICNEFRCNIFWTTGYGSIIRVCTNSYSSKHGKSA